jgi:ketosteroid isomerase-like protein
VSKENVDIVRAAFQAFLATGDFPEEHFGDDFVWDMSTFRGWPEQQAYEGVEGARTFLAEWLSAFDDWSMSPESFHDAGDEVVVVLRQQGTSRSAGLRVDMTFAQVITLRDGLYARMRMYSDPAEAFAAARLSAPPADLP